MREKCPNTGFFLVHIFPDLDSTRRDTEYLSVFSPNTGKYEPEKTPYLNTFHAVTDNINSWSGASNESIQIDFICQNNTRRRIERQFY